MRRLMAIAAVPLLVVAAFASHTGAIVLFGAALVAALWKPELPPERPRRMGPLR